MSSFRIRPRFKHVISLSEQEIVEKIQNSINDEANYHIELLPGHVNLKIPLKDRHYWSPQLNITLEKIENGTIIRGLYGPNPTVWAVFFFSYILLGLLFFFIGMWGLTKWNLGMDASVLWALPVFVLAALILYLIAQTGQKIGAEQLFRLHHFYEGIINDEVHIR